ncbi:hypothetical protein FFB58_01315 [Enterobacter sp. MF024]|uniref:hypothetical protein n=1 Tax=Enterobacter sp. MF024 TaxID=2555644 RepID=UPI001105EFA9|nr:hypothetical protein [Enterobacter sp. MF024]TLU69689.1 hypothetical protein FFB58_01315 [Enterobacter sp. MF024]
MMLDDTELRRIAAGDLSKITAAELATELLSLRQENTRLKQLLATEVKLPYVSASPVCDIEAGYAAGVTDSKEAIRRAGFFIEGDD